MQRRRLGVLFHLLILSFLTACGERSPSTLASRASRGWSLGNVEIVAKDLPGGGVTSMVSDTTSLYFNIYAGPLQKVAHTDTAVSTALPQDPGLNNRYEMQLDQDGLLYWSNGLSGGGDPGQVTKSSLSTQQNTWTVAGLNDARNLQIASGYLYFINKSQEVRRVPLAGTSSEPVYTGFVNALAVTSDGDIFFGHCPECPGKLRSVVSVLPVGETTPIDITSRDGGIVDHMQIHNDKLYVVDQDLIYSIDLTDGSVAELVNIGTTTFSFSVDDDGIYWVTPFPTFDISASNLDGSNVISVGTGPFFRKQGNLIYWYNNDRVLRRRTLSHE